MLRGILRIFHLEAFIWILQHSVRCLQAKRGGAHDFQWQSVVRSLDFIFVDSETSRILHDRFDLLHLLLLQRQ